MENASRKRGRPKGNGSKRLDVFFRDMVVLSLFDRVRPGCKYSSAITEVKEVLRAGFRVSDGGIRHVLKAYRGRRVISLLPGPPKVLGENERQQLHDLLQPGTDAAKDLMKKMNVSHWNPSNRVSCLELRIGEVPRVPRINARQK